MSALMTADEARWHYNNAREKYESAVFYKNECKNKIFQFETERKQKSVRINELHEKHSKFIRAQQDISGAEMRDQIESDLKGVSREFSEASEFFRSVASVDNQPVDFASHILKDDDMQRSFSFIEQIFSGIGRAKRDIDITSDTLEREISALKNQVEGISRDIAETQNQMCQYEADIRKYEEDMCLFKALERKLLAL